MSNEKPARMSWTSPPTLVGVAVLMGFSVFTVFMIRSAETADLRWTRLMFLYVGAEAVVFAAAGTIFGSQVQRGRVEAANERAAAAEEAVVEHKRDLASATEQLSAAAELRAAFEALTQAPSEAGAPASSGLAGERMAGYNLSHDDGLRLAGSEAEVISRLVALADRRLPRRGEF